MERVLGLRPDWPVKSGSSIATFLQQTNYKKSPRESARAICNFNAILDFESTS